MGKSENFSLSPILAKKKEPKKNQETFRISFHFPLSFFSPSPFVVMRSLARSLAREILIAGMIANE